MALKEAGIRLTLQGAAEYRAGLKGISQELRTMGTESKLAVAQLGNNAKITDTYQTQMNNLGKQMDISTQKTSLLGAQQKKLGDIYKELPKRVEDTNRAYQDSVKETDRLKNNYQQMSKALGENNEHTVKAKQAWQDSAVETSRLKTEYTQLNQELGRTEKELAKMPESLAKAELATQQLRNEAQKLHTEYRNQGGRLADTAKAWQDFGGNLTSVGDKMKTAGSYMTSRFTMPIVTGLGLAVKGAATFQTEMGTLLPLLAEGGNITQEHRNQVEQLGTASREMAISYGKGTSEINQGMAELIRNGYTTQQVMGMMPNILDASLASGEAFGTVMHTTANVLSQFNLKGKDTNETMQNTQRVVDSLTYVANATSSGFYDLGAGMAYVGPIANSLNMSVEETASILGIMSDAGIEASQGGTALRGALTRLLKPSKQNIEAFRELGISTSDYRDGLLDFPEILDLIATNTAHLTDEQRAALIAMAFGTEAQTAMNALVSAGGDALRDMTTAAEGATGATREIANAIRDTPEFKFQQSLAELRDVGIEIGSKLLPHVTSAISAFSSWVQSFNQLSSSTQDFIIKAGLFVAAVGPILTVLGSLTSGTGKVITAVGSMIQAFGKITTPKAIGEIGGALGQIPGQASAAGGSATLFSNPWVAGAAVVTAAVAGIGYLIYKEATKYEASHRESVKETEGAYQEWFDAVVSGSATAASAQDQIRASTEQTGETYHQVAERIKRQNHEIQQSIDDMWDGVVRESRMTGQIQVLQTSLRDALSQIISQEDVNYLEGQFNDLGVMLTNTLTEIGVAYNNNRVVTAEWAIAQVDNVNRVRESVVSNLQLQRDALIQTATKEAEYHANSEQWLQQETSRIEQQYEHRVGVVDRATATITEILQTAAQTGSAITDEEMVSMARSIQDFAKVSGQSLTEMGEAGELVGEALRGLATDAGLDILELSGIIDSETADMIRSMSDAEDRTNALWDALSQYDQYEPSMKILDVDAEQAMADIQAAIEAGATWEEFTPEEKVFMMQTMGEEAVKLLLATIGIDWNDLTPEEKELIANADSAEDVEEIIHQIGNWNNLSPEDKILNLEAQVANDNLLEIIRNKELWNNTDFYAQFIAIDTNAPDAEEQIIALIATHTGMSAEEIKSIMFETNASETASELEVVSSRVEEINGQQVIIHTMSDGTEVTQAELEETGFIAQSIDGTNVGITMGQTGAEEVINSAHSAGQSINEIPDSKTTSITSSLIGMIANLVTIGLYNAATDNLSDASVTATSDASSVASATGTIDDYNQSSGSMTSTSVTASTSTPGLPGDTGLIDSYNTSSGEMTNTSATASTSAPGLPGDTALVDGWNSSSGAMTDSSSTASTSTPSISGNTSAVWSWIGALNSTYSTSSSLTTYVDTVYRTFGSPTRGFAEGGHIGMFAEGGDIQWGGMFANGGNVPRGFMGIVGEAGPELFHVTKSGVSITPLAPNEKMRGVEGAIDDYMQGKGKGGGGDTVINITFKDPVVREEADFDRLSRATIDRITRDMKLQKLFGKGRT